MLQFYFILTKWQSFGRLLFYPLSTRTVSREIKKSDSKADSQTKNKINYEHTHNSSVDELILMEFPETELQSRGVPYTTQQVPYANCTLGLKH